MADNKIKTVFMGTPDIAVASLKSLINDDRFDVQLVVTQPDKKVGRLQKYTKPPVKVIAEDNNIKVLQPDKIKQIENDLKRINPDIIVLIAYGKIIPESILNLPKYRCVNMHASLLPKYRGSSVIQAPILNGDKETGITIMQMDKGLDTGPIIAQQSLKLDKNETAQSLHDKFRS